MLIGKRIVRFGGCCVVLAASACGGGGGTGNGTGTDSDPKDGTGDPSAWVITATLSRPTLTVPHTGTDTSTVTVTRSGGFTGAVTFGADAPPNMAATFTNVVTSGTTTTALLTVGVSSGGGVYSIPFPVHANGPEASVHSDQTVTINVVHNVGFWTTAPATMSVAAGSASGPTRVTFTKTGFTDDVTMSLALLNGAPTGITATFTPNPIVGDTVTSMTVLVDPAVPLGTYSLGVRTNGGGYQGTAPLALTVTAAATLTMSAVTNPIVIARGGQGGTLINLVRTNFSLGITPVITSTLPVGVTASFGPPTSFGPTVSLNVIPTPAAQPGTFTINVTSGGVGVPVVTIPITVTITP